MFAIILTLCSPSNPKILWETHKNSLCEDFLFKENKNKNTDNMEFTDEIFNMGLISIEEKCILINNHTLKDLGLWQPFRNELKINTNDLNKELHYDVNELKKRVEINKTKLSGEQKKAYNKIRQKMNENNGGVFFLDAPGGTGKTFLLNLILDDVRSSNKIALAIASSEIAATLVT